MSEVVFVHGVGQQQLSADKLESTLVPAMAGGTRNAGYEDIADRLWRDKSGPHGIKVRVAFYGDLFLTPGTQGEPQVTLSIDESKLTNELALAFLKQAGNQSEDPIAQSIAQHELHNLTLGVENRQGIADIKRSALASLAKIPWFAPSGMAFAERIVNRDLGQVSRYLLDAEIREHAISRVLSLIDETTKVVIGHSLGSVVAFEALHQVDSYVPLFITLGSPLGLRNIIYDRLQPTPPSFPKSIRDWLNVADRHDLVAIELDLSPLFSTGMSSSSSMTSCYTVFNGSTPHCGEFYLGKEEVGKPIAEELLRGR